MKKLSSPNNDSCSIIAYEKEEKDVFVSKRVEISIIALGWKAITNVWQKQTSFPMLYIKFV